MVFFMIFLIILFGILFGILFELSCDGFTTLPNFEIYEREGVNDIEPQVFWTHRYICEQFPFIVQTYLQKYIASASAPYKDRQQVVRYLESVLHIPLVYKILDDTRFEIMPTSIGQNNLQCQKTDMTTFKTIIQLFNGKYRVENLPDTSSYKGFKKESYAPLVDVPNILLSDNAVEESLQKIGKDRKDYIYSRCFSDDIIVVNDNMHNETGCLISGGKWDARCQQNNHCPYYKSNTNYANRHGGCNKLTGYCHFPLGMETKSYRRASGTPRCHNCNGRINSCCDEQKHPDYAFEQDLAVRHRYRHELARNGLKWNA